MYMYHLRNIFLCRKCLSYNKKSFLDKCSFSKKNFFDHKKYIY